MGGVRETHIVPVVTLDSLLEVSGPPDLIKIDVEGAEAAVLRGGRVVLNDHRPMIYIEVGDENVDDVTDILRTARYELFDPSAPPERPRRLAKCHWNTLAMPV